MIYDYTAILDDLDSVKGAIGELLRELSDYKVLSCRLIMSGEDPHTLWVDFVALHICDRDRPEKATGIKIYIDHALRASDDHGYPPPMDAVIWPTRVSEDGGFTYPWPSREGVAMEFKIEGALGPETIAKAARRMHEFWWDREGEEK